jgi:hypothetical protein
MSKKWEEPLYPSITIFDYEDDANERALWYTSVDNGADNTYDMWLDYKAEIEGMSGDTITYSPYEPEDEMVTEGDDIYKAEIEFDKYQKERYYEKTGITPEEQDEESEWNF